jgi:hypothetical protein
MHGEMSIKLYIAVCKQFTDLCMSQSAHTSVYLSLYTVYTPLYISVCTHLACICVEPDVRFDIERPFDV